MNMLPIMVVPSDDGIEDAGHFEGDGADGAWNRSV